MCSRRTLPATQPHTSRLPRSPMPRRMRRQTTRQLRRCGSRERNPSHLSRVRVLNKPRRLLRSSGRRKQRAAPRNLYFILVISRIVRLPSLLRVLSTLNSAPSRTIQATRTIQARNHIVRAPAIVVRVLWFGTYPHYRGHPTVLRTSKYLQALFLSHFCSSLRRVFWWRCLLYTSPSPRDS